MSVPSPRSAKTNVKVYDRPAGNKSLPFALIAIIVLVVLVGFFFLYKTLSHAAPSPTSSSPVRRTSALVPYQGEADTFGRCAGTPALLVTRS